MRIRTIDICRGLAVWMIAAAHVLRKGSVADFLASGGVAAFFLLGGLVYRRKKDWKGFWAAKLRRLYIPYLAVGLFSIILYRVFGSFAAERLGIETGSTGILINIWYLLRADSGDGSMKWNEPLWFIPCYLAAVFLADTAERGMGESQSKKTHLRCAVMAAAPAGGYLLSDVLHLSLPFQLQSAVHMLFFYELGILLQPAVRDEGNRKAALPAGILLLACSVILSPVNGKISIRGDLYPHFALSYGILIMESLGLLLVASAIGKSRPLEYLGQRSFDVLLWNKFPVLFFQTVLPLALPGAAFYLKSGDTVSAFLAGVLISGICCILCLVWRQVLKRTEYAILSFRRR